MCVGMCCQQHSIYYLNWATGQSGGEGLTVLAVDSVKALLALADVLAEDVPAARVASQLADGIVLAGVGVAGPYGSKAR